MGAGRMRVCLADFSFGGSLMGPDTRVSPRALAASRCGAASRPAKFLIVVPRVILSLFWSPTPNSISSVKLADQSEKLHEQQNEQASKLNKQTSKLAGDDAGSR